MNPVLADLLTRHPRLESCLAEIEAALVLLCRCYEKDGVVYLCGNGGSAADAEHIVGELMKSFAIRRPLPAALREQLHDEYRSSHLEGALRAVARASGLTVLGLAGESGGDMAPRCDVCIRVPETQTSRVQGLHLPVYHALCRMLEVRCFPA